MYKFLQHKIFCVCLGEEFASYPNVTVFDKGLYARPHGLAGWPYRLYEELHLDKKRWFTDWTNYIRDYDTILMSDCARGTDVFRYIRKVHPGMRMIYYYVNSVLDHGYDYPPELKKYGVELYTFDPKNAQEFGIRYKPFYYGRMGRRESSGQDITQDIFFVGKDKGRIHELLQLKDALQRLGLSCHFVIKRTRRHCPYVGREARETISSFLPYDDVCREIQKSRAILDYVRPGQTGMTLRPYEALHFGKKLITNNPWVKKERFYRPENIFVFSGGTDWRSCRLFCKHRWFPSQRKKKRDMSPKSGWKSSFAEGGKRRAFCHYGNGRHARRA